MSRTKQPSRKVGPTALGTGLLALDVVFSSDQFEPIGRWAGGTFGNVMTILSFLGWDSHPVSRLRKNDEAGEIFEDLKRWRVRLDFIRHDPQAMTPVIIEYIRRSHSEDATHRFSLRCPVCGKPLPSYRPLTGKDARDLTSTLPRPAVFFFDRVSRGALDLARWSAEQGAAIVFEPSAAGDPRQTEEALAVAHIVKFARDRFGEDRTIRDAAGPLLVIETLGAQGLRFRSRLKLATQAAWTTRAPFKIGRALDTAGSGDWCVAGLIHQLAADGRDGLERVTTDRLNSAISYGQALAAWNCGFEGARGGMYRLSAEAVHDQVEGILRGSDHAEKRFARSVTERAEVEANHHLCAACR